MKGIKQYNILLFISISAFFPTSCKKYVSVNPPNNQLVRSTVFTNANTANAAQLAIYSQMADDDFFISWFLGLSSDELIDYTGGPDFTGFFTNSLLPTNQSVLTLWANAYQLIYESNAVIEGVNASSILPLKLKNQLTGEAMFVRGLWNFYLVNLFENIPLVISTDYSANAIAPQSTRNTIYKQIVSDLKAADSLLNSNYMDGTDTVKTNERLRPCKAAAEALLARVYLWIGDWQGAESASTKVIINPNYQILDDLTGVFLKNSKEAIFQLSYYSNANTPDGYYFYLTALAPPGQSGLTKDFIQSFDSADLRRKLWTGSIVSGSDTFYYPYKYKAGLSSTVSEYGMVLRYAEQYLIRAEARVKQGNITDALLDLNKLRHRAKISDFTSTNADSIIVAIEMERRKELFTELGDRWLNLKRTGSATSTLNSLKSPNWQPTDTLYPIPQSEIINDPKLKQNLGYH